MIPDSIGVKHSCCNSFFLVLNNFIRFTLSTLWLILRQNIVTYGNSWSKIIERVHLLFLFLVPAQKLIFLASQFAPHSTLMVNLIKLFRTRKKLLQHECLTPIQSGITLFQILYTGSKKDRDTWVFSFRTSNLNHS